MAQLIAVAEAAEDIGSGLSRFLDPVADHSADVSALIGQCFYTSSALRTFVKSIGEPRLPPRYPFIDEDLITVQSSLHYTFKDVQRIIGGLGRDAISGAAYRRVWRELDDYFFNESGNTLERRLIIYRQFVDELTDTLIKGYIILVLVP